MAVRDSATPIPRPWPLVEPAAHNSMLRRWRQASLAHHGHTVVDAAIEGPATAAEGLSITSLKGPKPAMRTRFTWPEVLQHEPVVLRVNHGVCPDGHHIPLRRADLIESSR